MEKRNITILLLVIFIFFCMVNNLLIIRYSSHHITGKSFSGIISLIIEGRPKLINITSPENKTYNFDIGDFYIIDLNVSPLNFNVESWWYTLLDLKHDTIVAENISFTPNTTISAVRWSNKLIVYANNTEGTETSDSVTFFVFVPNSAPVIEYIADSIYVCENSYLSYYFNVTDVDEDTLKSDISPKDPFFVFPVLFYGKVNTTFEIISGTLDKDDAGGINNGWKTYKEIISISDQYNSTCCSDYKETNITVIEINNAPSIEDMGVYTVWARGENSSFYKQIHANDLEDGNESSGNLSFNITILNSTGDTVNLFNITQDGVMNYTGNESQVGLYNITVCVNDTGIDNPHPNISENCGQDGSSLSDCDIFSLTVTNENRQPTIIDYYPENLSLTVSGTTTLVFNISKYDPDGTIPDTYWYVDSSLIERDSFSVNDEFTYSFGCGVSGLHAIKAEITDGLLNDSVEWNLTVGYVECPAPLPVSGGGGGGKKACQEKWVCMDWGVCQNTEKSLEKGILSGEDYRVIKEFCEKRRWNEKYCGFQIRVCRDLNLCNTTFDKPLELQPCYYVEKPSCHDGVKNCHDGGCEFLIDCGGPCPPCPTCSDGKQNQGEEGIDCGGPCPPCPIEKPLIKRAETKYTLIIILLISIFSIIILIKLRKILALMKKIKNQEAKRLKLEKRNL